MKVIGSVKEDLTIEKRISITPETVKKFTEIGIDIKIEAGIGKKLHLSDSLYQETGAEIVRDRNMFLSSSDIICRINKPPKEEIAFLKKDSIHISFLDPFKEEKEEDISRLKNIQEQIHENFISYVKNRRGSKLQNENIDVINSKTPLEDLLVEKASILI